MPAPAALTVSPAPPPNPAAEAPVAPPPELPRVLAPPPGSSCRYYGLPHPIELRFAAGLAPFALLATAPTARLALPDGEASAGVHVAASHDSFEVQGFADAAALPMYPARRRVFAGVYTPSPSTPFAWSRGSATGVVLASAPGLRFLGNSGEAPCADVALTPARFDQAPPGAASSGPRHLFAGTGPVPVSETSPGAPLAELLPSETSWQVITVTARRAGRARVLWDIVPTRPPGGGFVVGWIPVARVGRRASAEGIAGTGIYGEARDAIPLRRRGPGLRCAHPVPLIARVGEDARVVGRVLAGALFEPPGAGAPTQDAPSLPGLHVSEGAALLVRNHDLRDCEPVTRHADGSVTPPPAR